MNVKKIIKGIIGLGAIGGVAYAAYKLGECSGEVNERFREKYGDDDEDSINLDDDEDEIRFYDNMDEPDDECLAPAHEAADYNFVSPKKVKGVTKPQMKKVVRSILCLKYVSNKTIRDILGVKPESVKAEVALDNPAVAPETEKTDIPTIKNLSQLKKALKPGMMFEITDHLRPECIGERRIVTGVSTVDFTTRKLDENGEPTGKDLHMEFDRAKNWTFDGGELTSRLDNGDMLISFHFIDSLEREQTVQTEKEPEIVPVVDEVGGDNADIETSEVETPAPDKGENFTITDDNLGDGGAKTKFRANVDAIKTLKTLEQEKRPATAEEKETLSKYVGWGALAKAFDKNDEKWAAEYKELSELLTPQEYAQARSTVNDAFYTSPTVIERQNGYKSVFK